MRDFVEHLTKKGIHNKNNTQALQHSQTVASLILQQSYFREVPFITLSGAQQDFAFTVEEKGQTGANLENML